MLNNGTDNNNFHFILWCKSVLYDIELMFGPSSDILMVNESSDEILNLFLADLQDSENVDPSTFFI